MTAASNRRLTALAIAVACAWAVLAVGAGAAVAAPVLNVKLHTAPSVFSPGETGSYTLEVLNAGDQPTDGPITATIDLPDGVETVTGPFAPFRDPFDSVVGGTGWVCADPSVVGADQVTCTYDASIAPVTGQARFDYLTVWVTIAPAATGSVIATAQASGGGATNTATAWRTTPIGDATSVPFGIVQDSLYADGFGRDGQPERQAGAVPFRASFAFDMNLLQGDTPEFLRADAHGHYTEPSGRLKNVDARLPRGFLGNPEAMPKCPPTLFSIGGEDPGSTECPTNTQVGILEYEQQDAPHDARTGRLLVYNLEPGKGQLARLGFAILGKPVIVTARLDPTDYSVVTEVRGANEFFPVRRQTLHLWGVPADPAFDANRFNPDTKTFGANAGVVPRAFLTMPTECGVEDTTDVRVGDWLTPGVWTEELSTTPAEMSGCEDLAFDPSMSVHPTSKVADAPTGLEVELSIPQQDNPQLPGTPPLRRAEVTLPEGMTINPAAASGLTACTDAQLRLGTNLGLKAGEPSCPAAAKVGTVVAKSPALAGPVEGSVYIRSQNSSDPGSGEMFRMALVVKDVERGLIVKLPGSVKADPQTGRLTTTFDENPQLPVSEITLKLKSGERAPLANPDTCGTKTVDYELESWGGQVVNRTDSFTIPCPGAVGFSPEFVAGSINPTGGAFSPFTAQIERDERDQYLSKVEVDMPKGVLAKLKGVALCPDAVAGDGTPGVCPAGSKIGTATVGAGSGLPFHLSGPVYLTGPYKGAPYGLSVQVPAKAGPFDLGMVKVRNALHVNPETAQASVVSDALPQIVKGVPARLRTVDVDVDRPDFTINPTSCSEKQVTSTLTSIRGAVSKASSRFQVGDCRALGFKPRLSMRLVGRKQMRSGGHPILRATLKQGGGQANIKQAKVTLPPNVVLDSNNSVDPKLLCGYDASLKADCPASSIIGKATLRTPLLNRPLTGPVHFVQGIRFGKTGNRIRTLPTLLVKLRGEVAINLRSQTNTDSKDRLVSVFPNVPDARAGRFDIQINGGKKGILVVTENRRGRINLCNRKQTALVETDAHNGKRADYPTRVKTPCGKAKRR